MRTPASAFVLALLLTGCGQKLTGLIRPSPPAETLVYCPNIPQKPNNPTDDDNSQWEADMIDLYTGCAVRANTLIRWHKEGK